MNKSIRPVEFCAGVSHETRESQMLLNQGDRRWRVNDSSLFTYGALRKHIWSDTPLLKSFLERLAQQPPGAVLDVAGGTNGVALQDLMHLGLAARALVTNYEDLRTESTRAITSLGHVDGDLIDPGTWDKIENWKSIHAPEGFAGVLHEPIGGLRGLPKKFYLGAIHQLIDWTSPQGTLMVSTPQTVATQEAYDDLMSRSDISEIRCENWHTLIMKSGVA